MLSQPKFFWNMTRKYIVAFSHIFNDIHITKINEIDEVEKDIKIPITYAGKRKFAQILQRNLGNKIAVVLPRMSFLVTGMTSDNSRKLSNVISIDTAEGEFLYNPVPYNFNIDLVIWSKHMDDMLQIVEQAAIFFKPNYTITVKEIPSLNIQRNITITLNGIDFEVDTDLDEDSDRTLLTTMNFTLKGFLYPPISNTKIIEMINIKFVNENDVALTNIEQIWNNLTESIDETITVQPNAEWAD